MRTILITGATGFLGRNILNVFNNEDCNIICCVRNNALKNTKYKIVKCDLNNPEEVLSLKNIIKADVIIHLGCQVGWNESNEAQLYVPNVLSTGCLVYLAQVWRAKFVFTSAAIVHGIKTENINKDSPLILDSAYGKSKALGEQLIINSGVKHTILRIAGIFGYNGPGHLGLNRAISDAMNCKKPTIIGYGNALRNYIYVKDVAQSILKVINNEIEGIHLLSGNETMPIRTMLESICDVFIPGSLPVYQDGPEALNQIIVPSEYFPESRNFHEALTDIWRINNSCY